MLFFNLRWWTQPVPLDEVGRTTTDQAQNQNTPQELFYGYEDYEERHRHENGDFLELSRRLQEEDEQTLSQRRPSPARSLSAQPGNVRQQESNSGNDEDITSVSSRLSDTSTAALDLDFEILDYPPLESRESWVERQRLPNEQFEQAFMRLEQQSLEEIRALIAAVVGDSREFHGASDERLFLWVADDGEELSIYSEEGQRVLRLRWLADEVKMNDEEAILSHALMGERPLVQFLDGCEPFWHYTASERLNAVREARGAAH
jgi:hypothetical protein